MTTKEKADYSELYQAINALKEELRLPVILYYIEDFNIREIAQILDITEVQYRNDLPGQEENLDAICEKVRRRYEV